ncbi:MAG: MFS transporter, partial [Elusimicrobiota bacterium]
MTPSAPLFSRDFSLWLGARFCSHMARKTAGVALAWQVYRLSGGDPLALGFIGLAEALPFLAAALWAGHLVDRRGHRRYLVGAEGILLLCAAALWALTFLPRVPLAALYSAAALAGVGVSFSTVASSAFVQRLVPKAEFSRAAAWNLGMFTSAVVVGPLFGGWILSAASARWAYAAAAGFSLAAWILSAALRGLPAAAAPAAATWQGIKEGVRFVRSQPLILACMSLDMVAVFFGDAVALFPIFADRLGAGPMGFGLLRASPAAGAAAVSLWQAAR